MKNIDLNALARLCYTYDLNGYSTAEIVEMLDFNLTTNEVETLISLFELPLRLKD